jgi:hypothetical protein
MEADMRAARPRPPVAAEFDAHAPGYAAGMENPLKALLGDSAEQFVALKLRWLVRRCRQRPAAACGYWTTAAALGPCSA